MSTRLNLDELGKIISTMEQLKGKLLLETREYEFSSLEEMMKNSEKMIKRLKIVSVRNNNERIAFDYTDEKIVLSFQPEDNDELRGVAEKIKKLIQRKLPIKFLEMAIEVFLAVILLFIVRQITKVFLTNDHSAGVTVIAGFIVSFWFISNLGKNYCRIVLEFKKEEVSFFKKRGEDFVFYLLAALVGSFVTWLFLK